VPSRIVVSTPTPTTQWRSAFRILIQLNLSDGVRKKEYDDDDDDNVSATATAARKRPNYTYILVFYYIQYVPFIWPRIVPSDQKNNNASKKIKKKQNIISSGTQHLFVITCTRCYIYVCVCVCVLYYYIVPIVAFPLYPCII